MIAKQSSTKDLKTQAKEFFHKHKSVRCPTFPKEKVAFNSKGLSHLFYRGSRKTTTRPEKEIENRVKLLPHALKVLKVMPLPQEESSFVDAKGRVCRYWAFEAVVNDKRIKVIVRQIGDGKKHFWSVIPAWRRIRGQLINAKGNLAKQ